MFQGGFGAVYKGKLDSTKDVAIKELLGSVNESRMEEKLKEFMHEAVIMR